MHKLPPMTKPTLYIFAISHYCEKARWALDYAGIDYKLKHLPPGIHRKTAEKLGAPASSLPILTAGDEVIQGSADIIAWADAHGNAPYPLLPDERRAEIEEIERRLDDRTGVHVRRYYYSEAIVDYPESVRPIFTRDLSPLYRWAITRRWPYIRGVMIKMMDLGPEQFDESKRIVEGEIGWLEDRLSDGRKHLVGDKFSAADIAAASLLAPLAGPGEHPTYANLNLPPRLSADIAKWADRPAFRYVRNIYARYR